MRENIRLMVAESFLTVLEAKEARGDEPSRPDTNPALARNVRGLSPRPSKRSSNTAAAALLAAGLGVGAYVVGSKVVSGIEDDLRTKAEIEKRVEPELRKPLPRLPFQK